LLLACSIVDPDSYYLAFSMLWKRMMHLEHPKHILKAIDLAM
jgi:hypothetical protein